MQKPVTDFVCDRESTAPNVRTSRDAYHTTSCCCSDQPAFRAVKPSLLHNEPSDVPRNRFNVNRVRMLNVETL
jgi:hypothetical protein